jgi:hypothetical protein
MSQQLMPAGSRAAIVVAVLATVGAFAVLPKIHAPWLPRSWSTTCSSSGTHSPGPDTPR